MSNAAEFQPLLQKAKAKFEEKSYDEARSLVEDLLEFRFKPQTLEDRLFVCKVLLKTREYEKPYRMLRYSKDVRQVETDVICDLARRARLRPGNIIFDIYRKANKDLDDGNDCQEAIMQLQMLHDTDVLVRFLQGRLSLIQKKPRDAHEILSEGLDSLESGWKVEFEKLLEECEALIKQNADELCNVEQGVINVEEPEGEHVLNKEEGQEENVLDDEQPQKENVLNVGESQEENAHEGPQAKNVLNDEELRDMLEGSGEQNIKDTSVENEKRGEELLQKSFGINFICSINERRGSLPAGFLVQGGILNLDRVPVSAITFEDQTSAVEAYNLMQFYNHANVLKGICILDKIHVIVEEVMTLRHWVEDKVKKFRDPRSPSEVNQTNWWEFIANELKALFRYAGTALTAIFDRKHGCGKLRSLDDDGFLISINGEVKLIPSKPGDKFEEIKNLKDLLYSIVGFPFGLTAEAVRKDNDFIALSQEFNFLHDSITRKNLVFAGHASLLDPPFVWDGYQRFLFIEKYRDLTQRKLFPDSFRTRLQENCEGWSDLLPEKSIFRAVYDKMLEDNNNKKRMLKEKDKPSEADVSVQSSVDDDLEMYSPCIMRFCSNVLCHYWEQEYSSFHCKKYQDTSKVTVEKELRNIFPWLYVVVVKVLFAYELPLSTGEEKWPQIAREEVFKTLLSYSPLSEDAPIVIKHVSGFERR